MYLSDYIGDAIVILFPFMVAIAWTLFKQLEARLPVNMQNALNMFTTLAVQQVEQQFNGAPSATKKSEALASVKAFFAAVHLPAPDEMAINLAIESAVFLLNQAKQPAPDPVTVSTAPQLAKDPQPIQLPTSKSQA